MKLATPKALFVLHRFSIYTCQRSISSTVVKSACKRNAKHFAFKFQVDEVDLREVYFRLDMFGVTVLMSFCHYRPLRVSFDI